VLAASPLANRQVPVQAWTGRELLEIGGWGGNGGPGEGTAFDPADGSLGRWQRITPAPVCTLAASVYHMTYDRCPARYRTRWTGAVADHAFVSDRVLLDAAFARPGPG
jgi:hypothetical protein